MNYFEHYAGTRDRTCDLVDFEDLVESIVLQGHVFLSSAKGGSPYPTSLQPIAASTTKSVRLEPHGHVGRFPLSTGADSPRVGLLRIGRDRCDMTSRSANSRTAQGDSTFLAVRWVGWVYLIPPAFWVLVWWMA